MTVKKENADRAKAFLRAYINLATMHGFVIESYEDVWVDELQDWWKPSEDNIKINVEDERD